MARVEMSKGKSEKLKKLAEDIVAAQTREIRAMHSHRTMAFGSPPRPAECTLRGVPLPGPSTRSKLTRAAPTGGRPVLSPVVVCRALRQSSLLLVLVVATAAPAGCGAGAESGGSANARKYSSRIAFLGVDSQDNRGNAAAFLKKSPVPYPHYFDPNGSVARVFRGGRAFPTTVFYDSSGKLVYTHIGAYATEAKLEHDVRRYALRG